MGIFCDKLAQYLNFTYGYDLGPGLKNYQIIITFYRLFQLFEKLIILFFH